MEPSLSCCHTCNNLRVKKNLLKLGKFSFNVMVEQEIFAYLKNMKWLILIVNKKLKIFDI